ncbi:MAG: DUF434 domain-containing protein [Deltaproteobacteria bacterium]|nr:DUF434 domain-containing protein [Deltaproteobacteria bacterium]
MTNLFNMTDKEHHRGMHPQDRALFNRTQRDALCRAVADLSLLLTRDYPGKAALKLVGDRYALSARQRQAISRSACSDRALLDRSRKKIANSSELRHNRLSIDGFNCLITIESAISGGVVIKGRDGAHRDLAGIHGSYRKVKETLAAIDILGGYLESVEPASVSWYLDSPVSNSGRLAKLLRGIASERAWPWDVVVTANPDRRLVETQAAVASCDSWVLDRCARWIDLFGMIMSDTTLLSQPWVVDLGKNQA